ncbi:hypothetical protein MAPG_10022 [Magnaporthiopsis poae ATCC 64411]|uniref:Helicase C-terminal domain-containing protein n=1 Tax=Magnaporthiopsis poae (strain ATCC 64411 / 73-15) TaxID=644358 RepID=A0A0C4EBH4_MAGP6|nr:hypothetical protein MAPG_10022 [Magnaporthiopsis poae ATCC 64411]
MARNSYRFLVAAEPRRRSYTEYVHVLTASCVTSPIGFVNQVSGSYQIRVMLLTLSCGAVGNPTLEDRELARIHRIGRTKMVTTIRFYIRDSFEEELWRLLWAA